MSIVAALSSERLTADSTGCEHAWTFAIAIVPCTESSQGFGWIHIRACRACGVNEVQQRDGYWRAELLRAADPDAAVKQ